MKGRSYVFCKENIFDSRFFQRLACPKSKFSCAAINSSLRLKFLSLGSMNGIGKKEIERRTPLLNASDPQMMRTRIDAQNPFVP